MCRNVAVIVAIANTFIRAAAGNRLGQEAGAVLRSWSSPTPTPPQPHFAPPGPRAFRDQLRVLTTTLGLCVPFPSHRLKSLCPVRWSRWARFCQESWCPAPLPLLLGISSPWPPKLCHQTAPGWWVPFLRQHRQRQPASGLQTFQEDVRGHRSHSLENPTPGLAALSHQWGRKMD